MDMNELFSYACAGVVGVLAIIGLICLWKSLTQRDSIYDEDFWG